MKSVTAATTKRRDDVTVVKERPILFSGEMVRAILDGRKTQTRRYIKPAPVYHVDPMTYCGWLFHQRGKTSRWMWPNAKVEIIAECPYGVPGDRLWVRETWAVDAELAQVKRENEDVMGPPGFGHGPYFRADPVHENTGLRWRSSIHMPRWASRITLEITGVRVERLQDISEADATAESCEAKPFPGPWWQGYKDFDGELIHQQSIGESPPEWMIEPKRMKSAPHLDLSAVDAYRGLWHQIHGPGAWDKNPWVWVVEFKRAQP